jgi:asparagine synthetase B (glutamine-hydrolysing)
VSSSVLELSGGYDSTLAGAAARSPSHAMRGISVEFPYYEFRFEAPVQQAVAAALGIPRTVLDGTDLFPYAPWDRPPRFDEPSVFVTGIRHAERVAAFAQAQGAARIYVGHGGDQLFSTDLGRVEPIAHVPSRLAFPRETRRAIARTRQPQWRRRSTGCFVYDARPDVWVKETFGATIRTPFSDLALFRAAQLWSRWCAARQRQPDKTILARAEADLLPPAVTRRKGKVAYDGVWMRAYAVHAEHIGRTLERAATILEHLGLSPAWLLRRARCLAEWGPVSDREVLAAYAVAAWLVSWGLERVSDVGWV